MISDVSKGSDPGMEVFKLVLEKLAVGVGTSK